MSNKTDEIRIVGGYRVQNGRIIDDVERIWFQCNKCKVFDYYHRNEIKCLHCNGYIDGLSLTVHGIIGIIIKPIDQLLNSVKYLTLLLAT